MTKFSGLALPVDRASRMTILHPVTRKPLVDAEKQPAYLDLLSADSSPAQEYLRTITQERIDARGRGKISAEMLERNAVERLAAVTHAWRLLDLTGKPIDVECSRDNAIELYGAPAMLWLREQAEEFIADRENFSKASSKN